MQVESVLMNYFRNILEVIENNARERTRTSLANSAAIIVLARWDFLSYPESYPSQSRAAVGPLGICWARVSRLFILGLARCRARLHERDHIVALDELGALEIEDMIADQDTDALPRASVQRKRPNCSSGSERRRVVGRFASARQRGIMRLAQRRVHSRESSFWCAKAACLGARLVRDHSSNMSHLTASSLRISVSSFGPGHASSTR
jgi:hypothetical protein